MIEFEMTGRVGRELRSDDVRIVAAKEMNLRGNAVINVIDPTKSYQPTFPNAAATCVIARRSIDARNDVVYRYRFEGYNHRFESYVPYEVAEYKDVSEAEPVIIVGAGPAGLFAALKLLTLGLKPVILERGKNVHDRKFDMARLSREGVLDPDSNYCYGEGGAGAFSDGKLFTRSSKRGDIKEVLHQFVSFGANPQILIDAHPHIGTDRLPKIVENIRNTIVEKGGEYHFGTKVTDIVRKKDGTLEVKALDSEHPTKTTGKPKAVKYSAKKVILASGHSARDIYEMLSSKEIPLEAKGFAMGVRVEHSQALINESRYHGQWEPGMPAAEYSFAHQIDERGVFSFCMCPGGVLVPSATEPETIVMNGMSNSARSGKFANAGVVVQIEPEDIPEEYSASGAFKGLDFQKAVERKMWEYAHTRSGNPMAAPAQRMIDFCNEVVSEELPETSYKPGVVPAPLHELLPGFIASRLQQAFPEINKRSLRGYFTNDALLLGVESRTSSPIRIPRNPETYESDAMPGLLPCGEGAGYSGGIVSSAIDGINCALAAYRSLSEPVILSEAKDL
ncbi:MAG: FAD-dependent oxidoreductase [Bacteroidales bacterium]|nr:FAD-dependent oxidoreductase [Bacteroidales bacterium]